MADPTVYVHADDGTVCEHSPVITWPGATGWMCGYARDVRPRDEGVTAMWRSIVPVLMIYLAAAEMGLAVGGPGWLFGRVSAFACPLLAAGIGLMVSWHLEDQRRG